MSPLRPLVGFKFCLIFKIFVNPSSSNLMLGNSTYLITLTLRDRIDLSHLPSLFARLPFNIIEPPLITIKFVSSKEKGLMVDEFTPTTTIEVFHEPTIIEPKMKRKVELD